MQNQSVEKGAQIFSVIPTNSSSFVAKLKTPSLNYGKIKLGQTVNLKLHNYPDTEFGYLKGFIKKIAQIPNKDGFYNVDVQLPKKLITSYNKEILFKHEMSAEAVIITEDLRLIQRLFYATRKSVQN
ncbi:MAG: hypothetical protein COB98_11595 [Flavobacteriaceae bacterium]|nr:MAG: hypothetical protein COB98_11595 [Flavobacteriaceae bacterium]